MNLMSKIPKGFYRLFASKYMDYYIRFLVAIYEESAKSYSLLGLTERECRAIMNEWIAVETLDWSEEQFDEEGELLTRSNMAFICLKHLEEWGWLRRDFDETLNSYVVSFPEYSQMFVELFGRLMSEDSTKERESVLAVYSYLYTYSSDKEKNNEILKSALQTSRSLLQMLANMQESMRGYFDELSRQRSFLGIQEVLVKEINNSDSKKYAILTTTDSFYRYKEAVKELIDQNLTENELRRQELLDRQVQMKLAMEAEIEKMQETESMDETVVVEYTPQYRRLERAITLCEEAMDIIYHIEREFDAIERRYNKLIEQKTVFASRAAARIRYILMEGAAEEDRTLALVNILNRSEKQEEILEKLAERMHLTERYHVVTKRSLFRRRESEKGEFTPQAVVTGEEAEEALDSFVLKPLYTGKEIAEFRRKNEKDGAFIVTKDTVQSMEDLEKLFFVWQEATEIADSDEEISVGEDLENEEGYRFSKLTIR
ncbi:MAG: Wadjet anti-phage system protein JetA family protein [Lachnospiraceae bacterium]